MDIGSYQHFSLSAFTKQRKVNMENSNIENADFSVRKLVFGSETLRVAVFQRLPQLIRSKSNFQNISS